MQIKETRVRTKHQESIAHIAIAIIPKSQQTSAGHFQPTRLDNQKDGSHVLRGGNKNDGVKGQLRVKVRRSTWQEYWAPDLVVSRNKHTTYMYLTQTFHNYYESLAEPANPQDINEPNIVAPTPS